MLTNDAVLSEKAKNLILDIEKINAEIEQLTAAEEILRLKQSAANKRKYGLQRELLKEKEDLLTAIESAFNKATGCTQAPLDLEYTVNELAISVRTRNCLKAQDIYKIGKLLEYSEQELMRLPNFGKKSLDEVKKSLSVHGHSLRSTQSLPDRIAHT